MISIGSKYFGEELSGSPINLIIKKCMKLGIEMCPIERLGEVPYLNIIIVVSGSLGSPDWAGVHVANFSKKENGLIINIGIQSHFFDENSSIEKGIFGLMEEAVIKGKEKLLKKKIDISGSKFDEYLVELRKVLSI